MHKSDNESNPGLIDNPTGCKKGKLVNQELVTLHLAEPVVYKDRGELKYEKRLQFMLDLQQQLQSCSVPKNHIIFENFSLK